MAIHCRRNIVELGTWDGPCLAETLNLVVNNQDRDWIMIGFTLMDNVMIGYNGCVFECGFQALIALQCSCFRGYSTHKAIILLDCLTGTLIAPNPVAHTKPLVRCVVHCSSVCCVVHCTLVRCLVRCSSVRLVQMLYFGALPVEPVAL